MILYVLTAGPDSPTSPVKDLTTHTRALKLKHQSLEDRLELCLLELRKLCIREAVSIPYMIHVHTVKTSPFLLDQHFYFESQELTGKLPSDYPLMPEEKPPCVRRRIGASFKLDEGLIHLHKEVQVAISVYCF